MVGLVGRDGDRGGGEKAVNVHCAVVPGSRRPECSEAGSADTSQTDQESKARVQNWVAEPAS